MKTTLIIFQILISVLLCTLIFLQSKGDVENGNILSETSFERRGWEKVLFRLTIVMVALFLLSSIAQFLV